MKAEVSWNQGVMFTGAVERGHQVVMEGPESYGGQDRGFRPMELILTGLGGCASFDVVTTLEKMREKVDGCVAKLEAERADAVPAVFTKIHITFEVTGKDLNAKKVERAVALSAEKYCSASIMLSSAGVDISHDVKIIESE